MPQHKTVIDLFGEAIELRASSLMSEGIPVSCFFTNGSAVADVALIRPYDGLVQFDDERIAAAVEEVRARRSHGFKAFFLVAWPILFIFQLVMRILHSIASSISGVWFLGFFSIFFALVCLAVVVFMLGSMAIVLLYAAPFLLLVFVVRMVYRSGSKDAAAKLKQAAMLLGETVARGESEPVVGDTTIIDVTPRAVGVAPSTVLPVAGSHSPLKYALASIPLVLAAGILGWHFLSAPVVSKPPPAALQPALAKPQAPAPSTPSAKAFPPAKASPVEASVISGTPEIIDTATVRLDGRDLSLAGLRPVNRPEARDAARGYLSQAGGIRCERDAPSAWRCVSMAKGIDIAEVFALSGFAKASSDAAPVIRDAERMARQNRRGIWAD